MKGQVIVFSIGGCLSCSRTKAFLDDHNLSYSSINLDQNTYARDYLIELTGKSTAPMVFFNDRYVGGWNELSNMAKEEFAALVVSVHESEPSEKALELLRLADHEDEDHSFRCEDEEIDEYNALITKFKECGLVKVDSSFVGKEAVDWLVKEKSIGRDEAVNMFRQILAKSYGEENKSFNDDDQVHSLLDDNGKISINQHDEPVALTPMSATKASQEIRRLMLSLYGKHLSEDGRKVDYEGIGKDPEFDVYIEKTSQLQYVSLDGMERDEKLAFFINIYNALVVHAFVKYGPPTNIWQRYKFFNTASYVIDGHRYCLQDIENGVLRSNRRSIGAFRKPFSSGDPRLKVALDKVEPRIHFALVCGAKSCPPISTYSPEKIDKQLDIATRTFLGGDDVIVDMKKHEVRVSEILKWYSIDFGSNKREIVQWIHDHIGEGEKKKQLSELLNEPTKFKLTHSRYNWDLNGK